MVYRREHGVMRSSVAFVVCACGVAWFECSSIGVVWVGTERVDWCVFRVCIWALSSNGRAPASHAGGRGIDTPSGHFLPARSTFYELQILHALPSTPLASEPWHPPRTLRPSPTVVLPCWRAATSACQLVLVQIDTTNQRVGQLETQR